MKKLKKFVYEPGVWDEMAQARKRDTMLDDMCNLIDERDILLAEKALLEAERDALKEEVGKLQIRVHNDMGKCVELEADLNELTFDRDALKDQNALLVEALKKIANPHPMWTEGAIRQIAINSLAAVKEADESAKQ